MDGSANNHFPSMKMAFLWTGNAEATCLVKVAVLVSNLVGYFYAVSFYVLLQHRWGCVTGDPHDVIVVHSCQIHQSRSSSSSSMGMHQFPFMLELFHRLTAFGCLDLNELIKACQPADFLHIPVENLIFKMRKLVVITL